MATALSIANLETIQNLLQDALAQRAKFFICLPREMSSLKELSGVLQEITDQYLIIEVSGLRADPFSWVSQSVTCYFSVRDQARKTDIFYNFTLPIRDSVVRGGICNLVLERPVRLSVGQRRSSLRLEPASEDILGFSLWEDGMVASRCPQVDRVRLREPLITREHAEKGLAASRNISAGGVRLHLSSKLLSDLHRELQRDWARGTRLVLWLALADTTRANHLTCWVKGRIRYRLDDYLGNDAVVGIEFTHHGKKDSRGKVAWHPVMENAIQDVGTWVYQRYLEQFRRGII